MLLYNPSDYNFFKFYLYENYILIIQFVMQDRRREGERLVTLWL